MKLYRAGVIRAIVACLIHSTFSANAASNGQLRSIRAEANAEAAARVAQQQGILSNLKEVLHGIPRASKTLVKALGVLQQRATLQVASKVELNADMRERESKSLKKLEDVEQSMLSMLVDKKGSLTATADVLAFAAKVLEVTSKEMTPAIKREVAAVKTQLDNDFADVAKCEKSLEANLELPALQTSKLPSMKRALDSCVLDAIKAAGVTMKYSRVTEVDWFYIRTILDQGKLLLSDMSGYVTGDFGHTKLSTGAHCTASGTSIALTTYTCQEMQKRCEDFSDVNGKARLGFCSKGMPALLKTNVSQIAKCRKGGGACCENPDATVCDSHGEYANQGDFYEAMFKYWDAMLDLWDRSREECASWCTYCKGNQTNCPISPPNDRCPRLPQKVFDDDSTSVYGAKPAAPSSGSNSTAKPWGHTCSEIQDRMDYTACDGTQRAVDACTKYKDCYNRSAQALNYSFSTVCRDFGDYHVLQHEMYAIKRIECILDAVNSSYTSSISAEQASAIEDKIRACNAKSVMDFDLNEVKIEGCHKEWPQYVADNNPICQKAATPNQLRTNAGTEAYKEEYYKGLKNVKTCVAHCCITGISAYKPPPKFEAPKASVKLPSQGGFRADLLR